MLIPIALQSKTHHNFVSYQCRQPLANTLKARARDLKLKRETFFSTKKLPKGVNSLELLLETWPVRSESIESHLAEAMSMTIHTFKRLRLLHLIWNESKINS